MRKIAFALLIALSVTAVAQEKQLISTAVIALDNRNDLPEAKKYIDQAGEAIKAKGGSTDVKQMSKYLYYKGVIYMRLALNDNPDLVALAPDGIDVSSASFIELLEFESNQGDKARYSQEAASMIPILANALKSIAFEKNEAKDYVGAAEYFKKAYELQSNPTLGQMAVTDTLTYFYTGWSYNAADKYPEAIAIFKDLLVMGYNGFIYIATSVASEQPMRFGSKKDMDNQVNLGIAVNPTIGPSERPNVYKMLLGAYMKTGNTEDFNTYLAQARNEYPMSKDFIDLELQGYLDSGNQEKALEMLNLSISRDSSIAIYYIIKGNILLTYNKDRINALKCFEKAISLDSNDISALYSAGLVYVEFGNDLIQQRNEISGMSTKDQKKYEDFSQKIEIEFKKALPYFEKAHAIDPSDKETITALMEVYRRLKMYERATEMQKLLES